MPVQIPQTTKAPSTAPLLLPRAAHHQHGPDDEGRQQRIEGQGREEADVVCKQRSSNAHDYRSKDERLKLELEHILAAGLGCHLILSYRTQHPPPGRLDHLLHRQEKDGQDHQHHNHVQVVVVFGRYPIAQELGYSVQSLGAVCYPLLVQEEEADRLRDAQGGDSEIVVLESQGDVANYQCDNPANRRRGPQAQERTTGRFPGPGTRFPTSCLRT